MRRLVAILALLALPALAQEPEDWDALRAQAKELRSQAKALRAQGKQTEIEATAQCRHKVFMSGCNEDARKQYQETERTARGIDLEAFDIEQRIRHHDHEVKLERRAEKDRKKAADAQRRAEEIRDKDAQRRSKEEIGRAHV
jgi:hypothetical protein